MICADCDRPFTPGKRGVPASRCPDCRRIVALLDDLSRMVAPRRDERYEKGPRQGQIVVPVPLNGAALERHGDVLIKLGSRAWRRGGVIGPKDKRRKGAGEG